MTAQTPVYGIKYPVVGEPIRVTRQLLEDNAKAVEAALLARAVAPPTATDLATLSGRVTSQAARVTVTAPSASFPSATATAIGWAARTARSTASMWSASPAPGRLVAPYAAEYDLSVTIAWAANVTGQRTLAYQLNTGALVYIGTRNAPAGGYGGEQTELVRGIGMAAGDYLVVYAQQNSGGLLASGPMSATLSVGAL